MTSVVAFCRWQKQDPLGRSDVSRRPTAAVKSSHTLCTTPAVDGIVDASQPHSSSPASRSPLPLPRERQPRSAPPEGAAPASQKSSPTERSVSFDRNYHLACAVTQITLYIQSGSAERPPQRATVFFGPVSRGTSVVAQLSTVTWWFIQTCIFEHRDLRHRSSWYAAVSGVVFCACRKPCFLWRRLSECDTDWAHHVPVWLPSIAEYSGTPPHTPHIYSSFVCSVSCARTSGIWLCASGYCPRGDCLTRLLCVCAKPPRTPPPNFSRHSSQRQVGIRVCMPPLRLPTLGYLRRPARVWANYQTCYNIQTHIPHEQITNEPRINTAGHKLHPFPSKLEPTIRQTWNVCADPQFNKSKKETNFVTLIFD